MLLSFVVPIIGYLLYVEWVGPLLAERQQVNTTRIEEALADSQLQATARAEVWQSVTADAQIDAQELAQQSYRATLEVEIRSTVEAEAAATRSAELLQQATVSAVETQGAFNLIAMEGTVSAQVQATSESVADATLSAYKVEQDSLVSAYVLATVQVLYDGDIAPVPEVVDNSERLLTIIASLSAFVVGGIAVLLGAIYWTRPNESRRTRRTSKKIAPSPEYVMVQCSCKAEQVLCYQCDGTGEVMYTDSETNRYMYRYCPRCNGTGYTDCEICSGRGQYYKEAKAIEAPVEEPQPVEEPVGWSSRVRSFFSSIDHITPNQRADS